MKERTRMKGLLESWFSITMTAIAVAAPQLVTQYIAAVPHDYQILATASFGVLGAVWHLYKTPPGN